MIKIICVGKLKESYWKKAVEEYQKRLSKYTKLDIIEVPDYQTESIELTQKKEMLEICKHLNEKDYIITLEIEGEQLSSVAFSKMLDETTMKYSNIIFIIGGSDGLSDEIKKKAHKALSFSKLTFPHQMFRVVLLEQIYRGFKIMKNESYHK